MELDGRESAFDRAAWLNRIGYTVPLEPTFRTLVALVKAHSHAIAYESIDIGSAAPLFQISLRFSKRCSSCDEVATASNNTCLFRAGLRSLGYSVTSLRGRVVRGLAIDALRSAIHMLLRVELPEGAYLADSEIWRPPRRCYSRLMSSSQPGTS